MISLDNITLRRGRHTLLDNTSLTIFAKQRIGLIGTNGSGKSTLFALLQRQFPADDGNVEIPRHIKIAHVSQETPSLSTSALDFAIDGDDELRLLESQLEIAENQNDGMAVAHCHEELQLIDAYSAPARASQLLAGLGFKHDAQAKSVSEFSGGWRVRLNLAKALMKRSDILLLDEPTNHLDLDAVLWLEKWLINYRGTLIIISHDRDFLDATVDHIVHLSHKKLKLYTGNYSAFETLRASHLLTQQSTYDKQQKQLDHMRSFVERFRYKASKARQAQSRLKAIERMELVCAVQSESPFQFEFPVPKSCGNPLINLEKIRIGYQNRTILENVDLRIAPNDRIGILGPNGAGKTSLIKLIAREITSAEGSYESSSGLNIGYFAQHQIDHLHLDASPLLHLQRLAEYSSELELRKFLGSFGFAGEKALEPVKTFSGGEKSRLALALLVWQKPNLLLLDEPTNHLDLDMRNALSIALQDYQGAMMIVSHDRFLLRSTVDSFILVAEGKVEDFEGDLGDYEKWLMKYYNTSPTQTSSTTLSKKDLRRKSSQERESRRPLQEKIKRIEVELEKLKEEAKKIEVQLTDQSLYDPANKEKLQTYLLKISELRKEIEQKELTWLQACEESER